MYAGLAQIGAGPRLPGVDGFSSAQQRAAPADARVTRAAATLIVARAARGHRPHRRASFAASRIHQLAASARLSLAAGQVEHLTRPHREAQVHMGRRRAASREPELKLANTALAAGAGAPVSAATYRAAIASGAQRGHAAVRRSLAGAAHRRVPRGLTARHGLVAFELWSASQAFSAASLCLVVAVASPAQRRAVRRRLDAPTPILDHRGHARVALQRGLGLWAAAARAAKQREIAQPRWFARQLTLR